MFIGLMLAAQISGAAARTATRPASGTVGAFTAIEMTTTDPAAFIADWKKPTPGVTLHGQNDTTRNKPITAFIVFRGCRPDPKGACQVTGTFQVIPPSGQSAGPAAPVTFWAGPPLPNDEFALAPRSMTVAFGSADAVGTYILRADVTDQVAGVTVHLDGPVKLHD